MRIDYFRKALDRLVCGSQTVSLNNYPLETLQVKPALEKGWFRSLLEQVVSEVNAKLKHECGRMIYRAIIFVQT